jgi:hypothetical protein
MALLDTPFVADPNAGQSDYAPLPAGWYKVRITEADIKETKAGTGNYIKVRYDVLDGTHAGRVVFGNLNLRNPNPKAEEIGRQQLSRLMLAMGLTQVTDTDQLIGGELSIKLAIQKSDQYGDSNDVKDWKALSNQPVAAAAGSTPPPPPSGGLPWSK